MENNIPSRRYSTHFSRKSFLQSTAVATTRSKAALPPSRAVASPPKMEATPSMVAPIRIRITMAIYTTGTRMAKNFA